MRSRAGNVIVNGRSVGKISDHGRSAVAAHSRSVVIVSFYGCELWLRRRGRVVVVLLWRVVVMSDWGVVVAGLMPQGKRRRWETPGLVQRRAWSAQWGRVVWAG